MLPVAPKAFLTLLLNVLSGLQPGDRVPRDPPPLRFELRHLHAVSPTGDVVFSDVPPAAQLATTHTVGTSHVSLFRPPSFDEFAAARLRSVRHAQSADLLWYPDAVLAPNVESRETLLELAMMTNNAYVLPNDTAWYVLSEKWEHRHLYGWEPTDDGFRGHVFATPDNSTIVLSIKGTSSSFISSGGPTAKKDKLNDNLLFSCCCARIDWTWTTVCGCYHGGWRCDQDCLEESLTDESLFYPIGTHLYNDLSYMYPTSNIWIIGHSMGGALASLLGVTFGVPVVAFESPGEKLAATRLHLPSPPSLQHITHVYHTADPIAMGTCTGLFSSCGIAGYAMETKCHLGKSILYDTVTNLSWSVDIRTHGIVHVIENVLSQPWVFSEGREVPAAEWEVDCVECFNWEFGDFPQ